MTWDTSLAATIINRIKELERSDKDKDVALALGVEQNNVSSWRTREIVPWTRVLEYARLKGVSMEWLLNGRGPKSTADMISEPGAIYRVETNHDAMYLLAGDIYKAVDEVGVRISGEKFAQIMRLAHRETLDRGEPVPYAKILELVKLAT